METPSEQPRLSGKVELRLLGVWANVHHSGHGHVTHAHPGVLSGALYLDPGGPEGTTLCMADPRPCRHAMEPVYDACSSGVESPRGMSGAALQGLQEGDLLVFPSWLEHHVPLHDKAQPRVSVSFN